MAAAGVLGQGTCLFTYGIDLGANLYAILEALKAFGWNPFQFPIAATDPVTAKKGGACPQSEKRIPGVLDYVEDLSLVVFFPRYLAGGESINNSNGHQWGKPGEVFGKFFPNDDNVVFERSHPFEA